MKKSLLTGLLTVLLAFFSSAAMADYVARNGNDFLVLSESQSCTNSKIVPQIPAPLLDQFHAATAHIDGKDYQACWIPRNNAAYVIYEDGDMGVVPASEFAKTKDT